MPLIRSRTLWVSILLCTACITFVTFFIAYKQMHQFPLLSLSSSEQREKQTTLNHSHLVNVFPTAANEQSIATYTSEPFVSCNTSLSHFVPILHSLEELNLTLLAQLEHIHAANPHPLARYLQFTRWRFVSPFCSLQHSADTANSSQQHTELYCFYSTGNSQYLYTLKSTNFVNQTVICYLNDSLWFESSPVTVFKIHGYIHCIVPDDRVDELLSYLSNTHQSLFIFSREQFRNRQQHGYHLHASLRVPVCIGSLTAHNALRPKYNLSTAMVMHPVGDKNNQSELRIREFITYHLYQGFEHFYLFDHLFNRRGNEFDRNRLLNAVRDFIDDGIVTYIQWDLPYIVAYKDKPWLTKTIFQVSAFTFAFQEFRKETRFLEIADYDLYLVPKNPEISVREILSAYFNDTDDSRSLYFTFPVNIAYVDVTYDSRNIGCEANTFETFLERHTCFDERYDHPLTKYMASTNNVIAASVHSVNQWRVGTKVETNTYLKKSIIGLHASDAIEKHLIYKGGNRGTVDLRNSSVLQLLQSLQCNTLNLNVMRKTIRLFKESAVYKRYMNVSPTVKGIVHENGTLCWKIQLRR